MKCLFENTRKRCNVCDSRASSHENEVCHEICSGSFNVLIDQFEWMELSCFEGFVSTKSINKKAIHENAHRKVYHKQPRFDFGFANKFCSKLDSNIERWDMGGLWLWKHLNCNHGVVVNVYALCLSVHFWYKLTDTPEYYKSSYPIEYNPVLITF